MSKGFVKYRQLFKVANKGQVSYQQQCLRSTVAAANMESDLPEMPPCNFTPQPYKGPSYEHAQSVRKSNISPGILTYYKKPIMVHQGHMQWLWDHEGKRYLDMFGGIVTVSVGHCHPKTLTALHEQTNLLWHTTNIYMHPKIHEYAEKLASKMPGNLKVVYLTNSGSEANDLAMLMARMYTGRFDALSFRNAYHGASPYLMGLTALSNWRYSVPTGFGVHQTMNPDVYRGPWGGANCRDSPIQTDRKCSCGAGQCMASDMYLEQMEDVLRHTMPKSGIAAFFAESIQGGGGTVQYPTNFLKEAFRKVQEKGGVCISDEGVGGTVQYPKNFLNRAFAMVQNSGGLAIADEVQTGFGRTGEHYWGFEGHGVMPDIVTMAKGIGNGFPLAAVVTTPEIAATMGKALHFNTYGGNPMSCAVGSAVLDIIDEEGCQNVSRDVGTYLLKELAKLRDEFQVVGDVRGKGFMVGLELVHDKETRTPLSAERIASIWEHCKDMGVLTGKGGLYGSVLRIKPAMCIRKQDVDYAIAVLKIALHADHEKHA